MTSEQLQRSLATHLLSVLDTDCSPEYEMTWKRKAMLSGAPICRLRASARPISGSGCSGSLPWCPTQGLGEAGEIAAQPAPLIPRHAAEVPLPDAGQMPTGWPTESANEFEPTDLERMEKRRQECKENQNNSNGFGLTLGMAAHLAQNSSESSTSADTGLDANAPQKADMQQIALEESGVIAGWATPTAHEKARSEEFQQGRELNAREALAGWPTCTVGDAGNTANRTARRSNANSQHHDGVTLVDAVRMLAGWTTPGASEPDASTPERPSRAATGRTTEYLGRQVSGLTPSSSPAEMASSGASPRLVLNPAFSLCFLMGYPLSWLLCGRKAIRSSRSRHRKKDESDSSGGQGTPS